MMVEYEGRKNGGMSYERLLKLKRRKGEEKR